MRVPLVLLLLLGLTATAEESPGHEHTEAPDARPNDPLRIFGLRAPFKIGPITSERTFAFQYQAGNTWIPTIALQDLSLTVAEDTPPARFKLYSANGIIRSASLRVIEKIFPTDELELGLNAFIFAADGAALDAPVSNAFIEGLHRAFGNCFF